MKKRYFLLLLIHLFAAANLFAQSDIVISQYIETNSGTTPKGIEVFNVSGVPIDFSSQNLVIEQGTNGGSCTERVTVSSGTILPNEVWVLGTSDLVTYANGNGTNLSGTTDETFVFNGNDALRVLLDGVVQDQFGICGSDPGSSWDGNGVSTANQNIALVDGICDGDLNGWTDPSVRFETVSNGSSMIGFGTAPPNCASSTPFVTLSVANISGLNYQEGNGPSLNQTFTASGSNLTSDITLSAPPNFEISLNGSSGFGNSLTLTQTSGSVGPTTIYVRLVVGLSENSYSGTLGAASAGATSQNISLNGAVTAPSCAGSSTTFPYSGVAGSTSFSHNSGNPPASAGEDCGSNYRIYYASAPATDGTENYFRSNTTDGLIESSDWGGEASFETFAIDVSGENSIIIETFGVTTGSGFNAGDEQFQWWYSIDGGSQVNLGTPITGTGSLAIGPTAVDVIGNNEIVVGFTFDMNGGGDGFENVDVEVSAADCSPSQMVFNSQPSSLTQSGMFSLQLQLQCPDNSLSSCDEGTVTLSSTACGLTGILTASVSNGVAMFSDLIISRSPQENVTFTAVYSGGCGSFTTTTNPINVLEPIAGGVLARQNYDVPSTWENEETTIGNNGAFSTPSVVGYGGSNALAYYAESCDGGNSNASESSVTYSQSGIDANVGVKFKFRLRIYGNQLPEAVTSCSGGGGIDSGEYLDLETSIDGGAYTRTFRLDGSNNGNYLFNEALIDLNHNDNITYSISNSEPSNFQVAIPDNAANVSFRFTMSCNRSEEVFILDDLILEAEDGETPSPVLTADVGDDFTGCNGGPNELSALVDDAQGALTYSWSPAGQISGSPTSQSVEAVNTNTQTFQVTVTDEDGCMAVDEVEVAIPSGTAGLWNETVGNESWNDCRNWADGKLPDSDTDVEIPLSQPNPIIEDEDFQAECRDLDIAAGKTVIIDGDPGFNLRVYGDITGSGSLNALAGKLIFSGSAEQEIEPGISIDVWDLVMDKTDNHLISFTDITVNTIAEFGGGSVVLPAGNRVILTEDATATGANESSFVAGIVEKQGFTTDEFIFPSGAIDLGGPGSADDQRYFQPASLTSPSVSTSVFEVQYFQENYNEILADPYNPPVLGLSKVSTCNYWMINRIAGSDDMRVGLSWNEDYCFDVVDPAALTVARFNDLANEWEDAPFTPGVTQTNSSGPDFQTGWVRTDQVVQNFSPFAIPFAIGAIGSELNVLPIELLWFDAERLNPSVVKTNWATAAEINNDFFTVERSTDGIHFVEIGEIPGAGNSHSEINYHFDDDGASPATTYYRLKQTDYDGAFTYSNVVAVSGTKDRTQLEITGVHNGESGLEVWHTRSQKPLIAEVFDLTGKRLLVKQVDGSSNRFVLHPQISRGIYFVRLSAEGEYDTAKFFY